MTTIKTYKLDNNHYVKHIELDEELSGPELGRLWKYYGNGMPLHYGQKWVTEGLNNEIIAEVIRR